MRILILGRSSNAGGGPTWGYTIAKGLTERGHEVRVIFTRIGNPRQFMHTRLAATGCLVEDLCYRYSERGWPQVLAEFIDSWRPNVLLIDNHERIHEVAEHSSRLRTRETRVVFIAHCSGTPTQYLDGFAQWLWKVITVSERAASTLQKFSPVVIRNSVYPPPANGEDIRARFGIPSSALVVGYLGRMDENKIGRPFRDGYPIWFDALEGNDHWLLLGGKDAPTPPPELGANAKDRCAIWPEPIENVGDWYEAMDVYVLPSKDEGFPLAPLEALLCGTRVAMTPTSDFPDIFEDALAFFPYGDAAAMRRAILAAPPAEAGQKVIAEHLSVERMIDRYEEEFQ